MITIMNFNDHPIVKLLLSAPISKDVTKEHVRSNTDLIIQSIDNLVASGSSLDICDGRFIGILNHLTIPEGNAKLFINNYNRLQIAEKIISLEPRVLEMKWQNLLLPIEFAVLVNDTEMVRTLIPFYRDMISELKVSEGVKEIPLLSWAIQNNLVEIATLLRKEGFELNLKETLTFLSNDTSNLYNAGNEALNDLFLNFTKEELQLAQQESSNNSFKLQVDTFITQKSKSTSDFISNITAQGYNIDKLNTSWLLHRDNQEKTALHHAVELGNEKMIDDILKSSVGRKSLLLTDNQIMTPLQLAIAKGNVGIVNKFLSCEEGVKSLAIKDKNSKSPLYNATAKGLYGIAFNILAKYGIRPDDIFNAGSSIIHSHYTSGIILLGGSYAALNSVFSHPDWETLPSYNTNSIFLASLAHITAYFMPTIFSAYTVTMVNRILPAPISSMNAVLTAIATGTLYTMLNLSKIETWNNCRLV